MTDILRVVGISIIAAVLGLLLRESGARAFSFVGVFALVGIGAYTVSLVGRLADGFGASYFGDSIQSGAALIMKIIGTGYIFGIAADICRELGEGGLANATLAAGRVEIMLLSLPTFREIVGLGIDLMK